MERNNTTEWRRAPLVDINDPFVGRGPRWMPVMGRTEEGVADIPRLEGLDENSDGNEGGEDGTGDEWNHERGVAGERARGKERRASNRVFAVARMKEKGRVGSCVGISGHKRVSWTRT